MPGWSLRFCDEALHLVRSEPDVDVMTNIATGRALGGSMGSKEFWMRFGPFIALNVYTFGALAVFSVIYKKLPDHPDEVTNRHSSVILNRWVREFWMWFTDPIFRIFLFFKVTPNTISLLGTIVAALSGVAFAFGSIGLAGWLMVLGASFDFFDGRMARQTGQETLAGSFFDSTLDRVSEGLTLTGIAYMYRDSWIFWVVMFAYLGSMLTSYTKSKGENMGVEYAGGMMQRPERIAYLGAGAILGPMFAYLLYGWISGFWPSLSLFELEGLFYAIPLLFVAFFSCTASANRIASIMKELDAKEAQQKSKTVAK